MKCIRCGNDIEADAPKDVNICGSCADDIRQELEYEITCLQEKAKYEQEQQAYEEAMYQEQMDTANGWRYV